MLSRIGSIIVVAILAAGCASTSGTGGQSNWDSSFGASNGGIADSEAGTAISVLVNGEFGDALQPSDRRAAEDAQERALRSRGVGAAIGWKNDRTGRKGQVLPGPIYYVNDTRCRDFTHELALEDRILRARGTACSGENGKWKIIG